MHVKGQIKSSAKSDNRTCIFQWRHTLIDLASFFHPSVRVNYERRSGKTQLAEDQHQDPQKIHKKCNSNSEHAKPFTSYLLKDLILIIRHSIPFSDFTASLYL